MIETTINTDSTLILHAPIYCQMVYDGVNKEEI